MDYNKLHEADFNEEGKFQWVAHKGGYRIVVRRIDGSYELIIREELTHNPTVEDWVAALKAINQFYSQLRIAKGYEIDIRTEDQPPQQ